MTSKTHQLTKNSKGEIVRYRPKKKTRCEICESIVEEQYRYRNKKGEFCEDLICFECETERGVLRWVWNAKCEKFMVEEDACTWCGKMLTIHDMEQNCRQWGKNICFYHPMFHLVDEELFARLKTTWSSLKTAKYNRNVKKQPSSIFPPDWIKEEIHTPTPTYTKDTILELRKGRGCI